MRDFSGDRNGVLLVGNSPRFTVVLYLDELQQDFFRESIRIRNNFRATGDRDLPTWSQLEQIAHITVAQRYLDQVDAILGRSDKIDADAFRQHFNRRLYMPYTLVEDLSAQDFAKLLEHLPVRSPLQLYTTTERNYPFGSAASHVLGYVGASESVEAEDFPGEDLKTFSMRGTLGRDGLEKRFDPELQGQPGGLIFRVDQAGYKVNPPIQERLPVQGKSLRIAGVLLCFIPIVGEFVIPDLLAGSDSSMIGQTLWLEFFTNKDWPVASAAAVLLLALLLAPLLFYDRLQRRQLEGAR